PSGLLQQHSFRVSHDHSTRMCWLGDKAVVLHWNQLAMAYDMDGNMLWEYMMDDSSGLLAGPDGDRVLLTDVQGNMVCLDDNGESIWERSGLLSASHLDNRIICISSDYQEIACIEWNGEELWSIPGMSDGIGYVYYAVDEFEPQFLLVKQAEYECR